MLSSLHFFADISRIYYRFDTWEDRQGRMETGRDDRNMDPTSVARMT